MRGRGRPARGTAPGVPAIRRTRSRGSSSAPSWRSAMRTLSGEAASSARSCSNAATRTCPAPAPSPRSCAGTTGLPPASEPNAGQRFEHAAPQRPLADGRQGPLPHRSRPGHPLTVLDDHSRFSILLQACADERTETVKAGLTATFRRRLATADALDNFAPWGNDAEPADAADGLGWARHRGEPRTPLPSADARQGRAVPPDAEGGGAARPVVCGRRRVPGSFDRWRRVYNTARPMRRWRWPCRSAAMRRARGAPRNAPH